LAIRLTHGLRQRFRFRHGDITIRGEIDDLVPPLAHAEQRLNDAAARPFYVEQIPDEGTDWVGGYKATPAIQTSRWPAARSRASRASATAASLAARTCSARPAASSR